MGQLRIYYKSVLQNFAYSLAFLENERELAKELYEENSEQKLEEYINIQKDKFGEQKFYFYAGMAAQKTLEESEEDGCDGWNACCGGLSEFEKYLGLRI